MILRCKANKHRNEHTRRIADYGYAKFGLPEFSRSGAPSTCGEPPRCFPIVIELQLGLTPDCTPDVWGHRRVEMPATVCIAGYAGIALAVRI